MKPKREHLAHFCIAGFTYHEGVDCFGKLKIGKKLRLEWEADNKYDARAVAIYHKNFKLGYVPRTENRILYKLLSMGFEEQLLTKVQMICPEEHPEQQVQVVVFLREFNKGKEKSFKEYSKGIPPKIN